MISPTQRPLPDNTQHSQQTDIHAPGETRNHNLSRRAAADLRPRSHWYRPMWCVVWLYFYWWYQLWWYDSECYNTLNHETVQLTAATPLIIYIVQYTCRLLGVSCSLMLSTILCAPLHHLTPISHFILINVVFCNAPSANHVLLSNSKYNAIPRMCSNYPSKIVLLIIPTLKCYVAGRLQNHIYKYWS
jgi:hypothetical protein